MRSNRLSQLIHNSKLHKGAKQAYVAVYFKKVQDLQDGTVKQIPDSQFSIKRSVNIRSQSEYYLNNLKSTQGEIKNKLASEKIDLQNNRFLILQGQVETIAQMKQKSGDPDKPGLLQYLEDIIGSNKYITRIEENVKLQNETEDKKNQKGKIVNFMKKDLSTITKSKNEAINYVRTEKLIYMVKNITGQCLELTHLNELTESRDKLAISESQKRQVIDQEKQKIKDRAKNIQQLKKIKDQKDLNIKNLAKNRQDSEKISSSLRNLKQEISFKSEDITKYQRKKKEIIKQKQKIEQDFQSTKQALPEKQQRLKLIEESMYETKKTLAENDNAQARQKIEELRNQVKRLEVECETLENKYDATIKKIRKMKEQNVDYQTRIEQSRMELNKKKEKLQDFNAAIEQLMNKKQRQQLSHSKATSALGQMKEILRETEGKMRQLKTESQERKQLSNMYTKIMEQKIPGVIGRLGDLGKVDKLYDEVITTANGSRLDNIVVNNYQAAKKVIEYMKSEKLGRISCIILDEIKQYETYMLRAFQPLKDAVRIFDQITIPNQNVRKAFYFVLQDTLYVENSQLGVQYAMQNEQYRRRVISKKFSKDGKSSGYIIYQINGLMIGTVARRGGFENKGTTKINQANQQQIADELKRLKQNRENNQKVIAKKQQFIKSINQVIYQLQRDKKQLQHQKMEHEKSILLQQDEINDFHRNMRKQLQKKSKASSSLENLELEMLQIEAKIKESNLKKSQTQKNLLVLQEQQKQREGTIISSLREKYKDLKQQYRELQKQISRGNITIEQNDERIKNNEKQILHLQKRIKRLTEDVESLTNQETQLKGKMEAFTAQVSQLEKQIERLKSVEQRLRIILEDDKKLVQESRRKVQAAKNYVRQMQQIVRSVDAKLQSTRKDIQKGREDYKAIIRDYNFLDQLEEVSKMTIDENIPAVSQVQNGMDALILKPEHLQSLKLTKLTVKQLGTDFPIERFLDTRPDEGLDKSIVEVFSKHQDKLKLMSQNLAKVYKDLGNVDTSVILSFKEKFLNYKAKNDQFQQVKTLLNKLKKTIEELKHLRLTQFRVGFEIINSKLKQVYRLLTNGGDADLDLIDALDPFTDGINFSVRPPKKAWKQINKLSGGQKTLSSLSLIFALHYYKPTPLYFMDQIDAALDFKNVSIVAQYIKKRTKNAQFIVISLRNHMFDLADKLVGIYKTFDSSKAPTFLPKMYLEMYKTKKTQAIMGQNQEDRQKENRQARNNSRESKIAFINCVQIQIRIMILNFSSLYACKITQVTIFLQSVYSYKIFLSEEFLITSCSSSISKLRFLCYLMLRMRLVKKIRFFQFALVHRTEELILNVLSL